MATGEADAHLPRRVFSTHGLSEREKFVYFCDGICDTFVGIAPRNPSAGAFDAAFSAATLGDAVLATIEAPGHDALRDRVMLSRVDDDAVYLNHMESAECRLEHAGRQRAQPRGTSVLLDSTRPFRLSFTRGRRFTLHSLRLPRRIFGDDEDALLACLGRQIETNGDLGWLIGEQMRLLVRATRTDDGPTARAMADALVTMLGRLPRAYAASQPAPAEGEAAPDFNALARFALANLANPRLSSGYLAAVFGCSSRTVQARFHERGTTASEWLLTQRLERARFELESERHAFDPVVAIARRCGFADATHFSRVFRRRYGAPPGRFRCDH